MTSDRGNRNTFAARRGVLSTPPAVQPDEPDEPDEPEQSDDDAELDEPAAARPTRKRTNRPRSK